MTRNPFPDTNILFKLYYPNQQVIKHIQKNKTKYLWKNIKKQ